MTNLETQIEQLTAALREMRPLSNCVPLEVLTFYLKGHTGKSTWQKRRSNQEVNGIGIPFTKGFHWTEIGGINYRLRECEAWLLDDPAQWDEMAAWRKQIQKIERMRGKV
jgi:hypothetical protein